MARHMRFAVLQTLFAFSLALIVAGCSSTASTTPGGSGTIATPTAGTTPTSAPTTCAQLPGFASAAAFSLTAAPANTVATSGATSGGGRGEWAVTTYSLCSPQSTTALKVSSGGHGSGTMPLLSYLPFINWGPNAYFPADGIAPTRCASGGHCFLKYDNTQFLNITHIVGHGHGLITWQLQVAAPPAAPACDSSFSGSYLDPTGGTVVAGQEPAIPLPPLTHAGQGQGAAGNHYLPLCSAGSGASVMASLAEAMPAFGWQSNGTNRWKQTVGSNLWYVEFGDASMANPITNAQNWLEDTHPPQPA
jgi:hypothetical protein